MILGTSGGQYHMHGGSLNVTGTIGGPGTVIYQGGWLSADTIAAGLNIAAERDADEDRGRRHDDQRSDIVRRSALYLSAGTLNLQSSGGDNTHRYLAVTVDNAALAVGATHTWPRSR